MKLSEGKVDAARPQAGAPVRRPRRASPWTARTVAGGRPLLEPVMATAGGSGRRPPLEPRSGDRGPASTRCRPAASAGPGASDPVQRSERLDALIEQALARRRRPRSVQPETVAGR